MKPKPQPTTKETADATVKQVMRMPRQFNPESPKQTFTKLAAIQKPNEFKGVVESQYTRHQREAKEMQHNQMIASAIKKLNIPQPKSKVVVANQNLQELSKSQRLNYEISNQNTQKYLQRLNKPMGDSRIVEMQNLMKMNSPGMFSVHNVDTDKKSRAQALNLSVEKEALDSPLRPVQQVGQVPPAE